MPVNKSKKTCYLLALFLGGFGAHLFYMRRYKRAVLYLIFSWTYVPFFLGWLDMLFINRWFRDDFERITGADIHKIESTKNDNKIDDFKLDAFYSMKNIILEKYSHLKTPQYILDSLDKLRGKKNRKSGGMIVEVSIGSSYTEFAKDSIKYAHISGTKVPFKPLMAYWTTFRNLNDEQKRWYFFWRERVLNGEYPDTDLSYIILFAYELLNYTFNDDASFNASMLERLYENYKDRDEKLKNYLPNWIRDFLIELDEMELAKFWGDLGKYKDDSLYEKIMGSEDKLEKISITVWKHYLYNYRETEFFKGNKNKIYDTFKKGVALLNEIYRVNGESIAQKWFEEVELTNEVYLFNSAVIGREVKKSKIKYTGHHATKKMYDEILTLFRMSENVTRSLGGEKRELKVQSELLPVNFREMLTERMKSSHSSSKVKDRFKLVQEAKKSEEVVKIPSPEENRKEDIINFDMERIALLNSQSEEIQKTFREKGYEDDDNAKELFQETAGEKTAVTIEEEILEEEPNEAFLGYFDVDEDVDEFINSLNELEVRFLGSLDGLRKSINESNTFFRNNGLMAGNFISSVNEKSNEYLDDNLIETNGDYYEIYEDYEEIINRIKKGDVNEN